MDAVPPCSSSTVRRKQSPTPLGSSPGLLIDPVPPASCSGLLIDPAPPAPASTAPRPRKYRRVAPIPPIRRSPFSKRLTYLLRLGRERDKITSSALTSSSSAGDDGRGDCNGLSSRPHTSSSLAAIDEIQQLTSSSSAGDESPPPLTTSSSASDEIQPPLTTSSSSVDPHPAWPSAEELWLADLMMWYRSIVFFVGAVVVIYNEHDCPAVMLSQIAGVLCIYMHFWSMHITQFWLNCPHDEDPSPIMLLYCLTAFMFAFPIAVKHSVIAAMCFTFLITMCMAGYLISCIREYNCTRRRQNLEHPLDSDFLNS